MASLAVTMIETMILGSKTMGIISTVGKNIIIKTLTTTTSGLGSLITYFTHSNQPGVKDINETLREIDLNFTIKVIEELVLEYDKKEIEQRSIKKALLGVNEILTNIHEELSSIQIKVEEHGMKWFSNWRSLDCKESIDKIKRHKLILDHRYRMLIDLLKI